MSPINASKDKRIRQNTRLTVVCILAAKLQNIKDCEKRRRKCSCVFYQCASAKNLLFYIQYLLCRKVSQLEEEKKH